MISKTLTQLAYPLSLSLLLTLLGAVFVWRGQKRPAGLSLLCSLLVLWVPSTPAVSDYLRASLERRHLPMALEQVPKADAIVVLGGAVGAALPPRLTMDLSGASDRVLYAAQLYQAGKAWFVIASGGALPWQSRGPAEAYAMAALLTEWGVPQEATMLETTSRNTYENAVNSKRLLEGARPPPGVARDLGLTHAPGAGALSRPENRGRAGADRLRGGGDWR